MRLFARDPWMHFLRTHAILHFFPLHSSQSFHVPNSIIMWFGQSICKSWTVCTIGIFFSAPARMTDGVSWKLMLLKWMMSGWKRSMTCRILRRASPE